MARLRTPAIPSNGEDVVQMEHSHDAGGYVKWYHYFWETLWLFLIKLNVYLLHGLAIPLLGTYLRELSAYVHQKTCRRIFIGNLFIIVKYWKFKCRSTRNWKNNL